MDYHLQPIVFKESSSTVSALSAGLAAVGLMMLPYFNPVVCRKNAPQAISYGGTEANTTITSTDVQTAISDVLRLVTDASERDLWEIYLASILEPIGTFSARQVKTLKAVWLEARDRLGDCPIPITQPADDGSLQFAWDNRDKYIDIEVLPDGTLDWYFRDRTTGEVAGTPNQPTNTVGDEFFERLASVIAKTANQPPSPQNT